MFTCVVRKHLQLFCVVLCAICCSFITTAIASPTISFNLPQSFQGFPSFATFTQQYFEKRNLRQMKTYSGKRLSNDSLIMIYYHDSTIAVTELGPKKLLLSCELIEIYNENDGKTLLDGLSQINRPMRITFDEMLKLMKQCEHVDKLTYASRYRAKSINVNVSNEKLTIKDDGGSNLAANIFPKSPFTIFSGIIPGTKWCGTGDIAETYSDLGTEIDMDRCCRQHDLCPVKIRAYQNKYDLMNESLYTKSHCICDDMLYACLKRANTPAAQVMGSIYFNLVQVPCLAGNNDKYSFRAAKEGF